MTMTMMKMQTGTMTGISTASSRNFFDDESSPDLPP